MLVLGADSCAAGTASGGALAMCEVICSFWDHYLALPSLWRVLLLRSAVRPAAYVETSMVLRKVASFDAPIEVAVVSDPRAALAAASAPVQAHRAVLFHAQVIVGYL